MGSGLSLAQKTDKWVERQMFIWFEFGGSGSWLNTELLVSV